MLKTTWGLYFTIVSNGHWVNPELMDYLPAISRENCIQMAIDKWAVFYTTDTFDKNLHTYCWDYPNKDDRMTRIICEPCGACEITKKLTMDAI